MLLHFFMVFALAGYGLGGLFYLLFIILQRKVCLWSARTFLALGFFSQVGFFVMEMLTKKSAWDVGPSESLALFSAFLALGFFALGVRLRVHLMGVLVPLVCFLLFLASLILRGPLPEVSVSAFSKPLQSFWLPVHIFGALGGEALFGVTACLGVLYLLQERELKSRRPRFLMHLIPSLESLDHFIAENLKWGFMLLTIGLLAGALWAFTGMQHFWTLDLKQVCALVTWSLYAVMLHVRLHYHWNGRKGAIFSIVGFGLVFVVLLGTNLFYGNSHRFWERAG